MSKLDYNMPEVKIPETKTMDNNRHDVDVSSVERDELDKTMKRLANNIDDENKELDILVNNILYEIDEKENSRYDDNKTIERERELDEYILDRFNVFHREVGNKRDGFLNFINTNNMEFSDNTQVSLSNIRNSLNNLQQNILSTRNYIDQKEEELSRGEYENATYFKSDITARIDDSLNIIDDIKKLRQELFTNFIEENI